MRQNILLSKKQCQFCVKGNFHPYCIVTSCHFGDFIVIPFKCPCRAFQGLCNPDLARCNRIPECFVSMPGKMNLKSCIL